MPDSDGEQPVHALYEDPCLPEHFTKAAAKDILSGFKVDDDESQDFLEDLIASGSVPEDEMKALLKLAVLRGAEDWMMLIERAISMRNQTMGPEYGIRGVLFCIEAIWRDDLEAVERQEEFAQRFLELQAEREAEQDAEKRKATRLAAKAPEQDGLVSGKQENGEYHFFQAPNASDEYEQPDEEEGKKGPRRRIKSSDSGSAAYRKQNVSATKTNKAQDFDASRGRAARTNERCTTTNTCTTKSELLESASGHDVGGLNDEPLVRREREDYMPTLSRDQGTNHDFDLAVRKLEGLLHRPNFAVQEAESPEKWPAKTTKKSSKSPYFDPPIPAKTPNKNDITPSPRKSSRPARGTVSALPVPPLSESRFGLVQEELAHDPFRLLIAITFLVRTPGKVAIPIFQQLMDQYPTPEALASADPADIVPMIKHLGLGVVRCATVQKYARIWMEQPPSKSVRFGVKNYPRPGDGKDIRAGEEFGPEDDDVEGDGEAPLEDQSQARGSAWEIGHLTQGRYALDSWRIFCRDVLIGRAQDWKGGGRDPDFQPEWKRVLPEDKELRACLRWMWMREGWEWDPATGEREVLREELRRAVNEGRVGYNGQGQLQILDLGI